MFKPLHAKTPQEYLESLSEPRKTEMKLFDTLIRKTVPNLKPIIISGMIGYGTFHYKSKSGREGEWSRIGLASQKNYISLYLCAAEDGQYIAEKYKAHMPKADIGKSCIRIKKADDIDPRLLVTMLRETEKSTSFMM